MEIPHWGTRRAWKKKEWKKNKNPIKKESGIERVFHVCLDHGGWSLSDPKVGDPKVGDPGETRGYASEEQ